MAIIFLTEEEWDAFGHEDPSRYRMSNTEKKVESELINSKQQDELTNLCLYYETLNGVPVRKLTVEESNAKLNKLMLSGLIESRLEEDSKVPETTSYEITSDAEIDAILRN